MSKTIVTAIGNPNINNILKEKYPNDNVKTDIMYQEALLEIVACDIPNVLILNDKLPGGLDRKKLVEKLRNIDRHFKIIVVTEDNEEEYKNYLISKGIFDILINDKSEIEDLIKCIDNNSQTFFIKDEVNKELKEEIKTLKQLLLEKPTVVTQNYLIPQVQKQEIICVCGASSCGKSDIVTQISIVLAKKSKAKILVMDLDTEHPSLDQYFGIPIAPTKIQYNLGADKNSSINYMIDAIDKNKFDSELFEQAVVKHKNYDNLDILTGNYSLFVCQNILNDKYYEKILNKAREIYDFIIIDTSSNIFLDSTHFAVTAATKVFFVVEPTYMSLRRSIGILNNIFKKWDVLKEKIQVIVNKCGSFSLDKNLVQEMLGGYNTLGYIKYDERHQLYLNKNTPMMARAFKKDELIYEDILAVLRYIPKLSLWERWFKPKEKKLEEVQTESFESDFLNGGL